MIGLIAWLPVSCTKQRTSALQYAHIDQDGFPQTPAGRLRAIALGKFKLDDSSRPFDVCVEPLPGTISSQEVNLEVRLALAAWITASFSKPQLVFDSARVVGQVECPVDESSYAIVVKGKDSDSKFSPPTIQCNEVDRIYRCSSSITKAFGSVSELKIFAEGPSQKWVRIESSKAAKAIFHPSIQWHNLAAEVDRIPNLADAIGNEIKSDYAKLLSSAASFDELMAFNRKLERFGLVESQDRGFGKAMETLQVARKSGTFDYTPESALLHTLLHEMGHTFGLDHADNPEDLAVTGQSATTTPDANGRHVTTQSTMAYGLPYLYLMQDDQAGAKALAEAASAFVDKQFK